MRSGSGALSTRGTNLTMTCTNPKIAILYFPVSMTYGIFFKKSGMDFFKEKFHIDIIQVCFIGNFGKISFGNVHVHKLK